MDEKMEDIRQEPYFQSEGQERGYIEMMLIRNIADNGGIDREEKALPGKKVY
jgi:hypothetical protein